MRSRQAIPALAIIAVFAGSAAWAETEFKNPDAAPSGAHYKNRFSEPVCTVGTTSVSCTGTQIGGIGNLDGDLVLSVSTSGTVQCRNHGGNIVEVKSQLTGTTSGDALTDNRNGTLIVSAISAAVATADQLEGQATCPNQNWNKELLGSPSVSFVYRLTMDGFGSPIIHKP